MQIQHEQQIEINSAESEENIQLRKMLKFNPQDTIDEANELAANFNDIDLHIFNTPDELPAEILSQIEQDGIEQNRVRAWIDMENMRDVYLVASNVRPSDVSRTLGHEIIGHKGLRSVFGENFNTILDSVYNSHSEELIQYARTYNRDTETIENRRYLTEEFLSDCADANVKPSWWKEFIASIRQMLRRIFPKMRISDADINGWLSKAHRAVQQQSPQTGNNNGARFSIIGEKGAVDFNSQINPIAMPKVPDGINLKSIPEVRDYLIEVFSGSKFEIQSDGRPVAVEDKGIQSAVKKRNKSRQALFDLKNIVETSFFAGYEYADKRHLQKSKDLNGQFVYANLLNIENSPYAVVIKLDDFANDDYVKFKDIAVKEMASAVRGSTDKNSLANPPAQMPEYTIQEVIDFVKSNFKENSLFSENVAKDFNDRVDAAYFSAVNRGDMETAQQMAENKAMQDGYKIIDPEKLENFLFYSFTLRMPFKISSAMTKWDYTSKSPYSFSYYNMPGKSWEHTPEGIIRVADHWNFYSRGEQHCITDVPVEDNTHWTIAQYQNGTYHVIDSLPKLDINASSSTDKAIESENLKNAQHEYPQMFTKKQSPHYLHKIFIRNKNTGDVLGRIVKDNFNSRFYEVDTIDGNRIKVLKKNAEVLSAAELKSASKFAIDETDNVIKTLAPITYDDDGNIIPLSQRFNKRKDDIRFSVIQMSEDEQNDYVNVLKPFMLKNPTAGKSDVMEFLKGKGVNISDKEAWYCAMIAHSENKSAIAKERVKRRNDWLYENVDLYRQVIDVAGSDFKIKPSLTFDGEDFTGSFISPEFRKYSRKRKQRNDESDKQYKNYLKRREKALANAEGMSSDEIAQAIAEKYGQDAKFIPVLSSDLPVHKASQL